jgi:hypothetical protein
MANQTNEGYTFKKLADAEEITQLSQGDSVVIISDNDTRKIDNQNFVDDAANKVMGEVDPKVDAAIERLEDDVLVALEDTSTVEELPETAKVVVVDEITDPETGEVTKDVKRVPSDQFGKGGKQIKWYTITPEFASDSYFDPQSISTEYTDGVKINEELISADPATNSVIIRGDLTDDVVINDHGTELVLGEDYTYENLGLTYGIIDSEFENFYSTKITFETYPSTLSSIYLEGAMRYRAPQCYIYEGSDYMVPYFHTEDEENPAVVVDPQIFMDDVFSTEYDVYVKGGVDLLTWLEIEGVAEKIEIVEGQDVYTIGDIGTDSATLFISDQLIPDSDYVVDYDSDPTTITFTVSLEPGTTVMVLPFDVLNMTTYSAVTNGVAVDEVYARDFSYNPVTNCTFMTKIPAYISLGFLYGAVLSDSSTFDQLIFNPDKSLLLYGYYQK